METPKGVPEIKPLASRREKEKKRSGLAWFFGEAPTEFGGAAGGAGEGAVGWLGQLSRWTAQAVAITATIKGRALVVSLCMALAGLNYWYHSLYLPSQMAQLPPPGRALFNGYGLNGRPAYEMPDLWNSDLSQTPNSVALVAGGKEMDAAAKARAAAKAAAEAAAAAGRAGEFGAPNAAGGPAGNPDPQFASSVGMPGGPGDAGGPGALKGALLKGFKPVDSPKVGSSTALFGGVGRAFDSIKTLALKPFAGQARVTRAVAARPSAPHSHGNGPARRALDRAFFFGGRARASGSNETSSVLNGVVFDQSHPAGAAIAGSGDGIQGNPLPGGSARGDEYSRGGPTGGGSSSPGSGSETGQRPDDCNAIFPDGGYVSTPEGGCAPDAAHQNATPWQQQSNMVQMLMMMATMLLMAAEIIGMLAKKIHWLHVLAMILAMAAAALGVMVIMLGMFIKGQQQGSQGMMNMMGGIMITVMAILCAMGEHKAAYPKQEVLAETPPIQSNLGGTLKCQK